jgi:hypothetical protein
MKRFVFLLTAVLFTSTSFGQSVDFKDSTNDTLITINDEGPGKSSITIQNSGSAPGILTDKLYNVGHSLFWNGSLLGTGGSSVWSLNGSNAYYNSGHVGIGTNNPARPLTVYHAFNSYASFQTAQSDNSITDGLMVGYSDLLFSVPASANMMNYENSPLHFGTNGAQRMTIAADGNVGIGTTNPGEKLHVQFGNILIKGDLEGEMSLKFFDEDTGNDYEIGSYNSYDEVLSFKSNGTERMNIGAGGKVSIGTMKLTGPFEDKDGQAGTAGQILSSTATGTDWITVSGGGNSLWNLNGSDIYYNAGNVGIGGVGVITPKASLHIDGTDGLLVVGTQNNGTTLNLGAGTRMHFYPKKAAFRAGHTGGAFWDDANIGPLSTAMGFSTTASGPYSAAIGIGTIAFRDASVAMGGYTEALGHYSTAIGRFTKATTDYATAMGDSTTASGYASTAMGLRTTASGRSSTTMGWLTEASGRSSIATGSGTTASGYVATAMGSGTTASGWYSTAMGFSTTASGKSSIATGVFTDAIGERSTAMGYKTEAREENSTAMGESTLASGYTSTAMGYETTASGEASTTMGDSTIASGYASTAMGWNTTAGIGHSTTAMGNATAASGNTSTAMGYSTIASGIVSTTMGSGTTASEYASTAMGQATTASGIVSTAMGYSTAAIGNTSTSMGNATTASGENSTAMGAVTSASGAASTAMGWGTVASGFASTAMGQSSESSSNSSTALGYWTDASGFASTAMGQYTTASGEVSTAMGSYVSTNAMEGSFNIGDKSTTVTTNSDADNQMTMRFAGGYRLFTNAAVTIGAVLYPGQASWGILSDSTRKENYQQANGEYFLNSLSKLRLGSWNYKVQDKSIRHYGPMAQEVFHYFGKDAYGTIGNDTTLTTADMDGIMMIAIQALEKRTADLLAENKKMKMENDLLKQRLDAIEVKLSDRHGN